MNRRIFLKILGVSPLVPSVLKAKPKSLPKGFQEALNEVVKEKFLEARKCKVSSDIYGSPDILQKRPKGIRTLNFNPGDAFKERSGTEFVCDKGKCVQFTFTTEDEGIVHCETWASNGDGRLVRLRQDDLPSLLTFNKV